MPLAPPFNLPAFSSVVCVVAAAIAATGGTPDPSVIAAGGPFFMESLETLWPLELIFTDSQGPPSLFWGPLRCCIPRLFAVAEGLWRGPSHQQHRSSSSSNSSSMGSAAGRLLQLLLQLLRLICSAGALAWGGALGALLAAAAGAPLGPLRLRRVSWCVSLEGGGYLLLSHLSPLPSESLEAPKGGPGDPRGAPAKAGNPWLLLKRGAFSLLRLAISPLWGPPQGAPKGAPHQAEAPSNGLGGFEAFLFTPIPQELGGPHRVGPHELQQLQQQHHRSLASLRFGGAPPASTESGGPRSWGSPSSRMNFATGGPYTSIDGGSFVSTLKPGAPEELQGGPPVWPTLPGEGPCLITWIGSFQWGPPGAPRWLGALLTLKRAEGALGALLSQVGARRGLHAVGPLASVGLRGPPGAPKQQVGGLRSHFSRRSSLWGPPETCRLHRGTPRWGPLLLKVCMWSDYCVVSQGSQEGLLLGPPFLAGETEGPCCLTEGEEGPLIQFYQTQGALGAPEAEALATQRLKQRRQALET